MKFNNKWLIWFCCSIFYGYQYVLRVLPNILTPYFIENLHVKANKIGQMSGIYYIGYSLIHIPLGVMLDKFPMKYVLPLFIILASIGNLPLIYSDNWQLIAIGRFIVGVGSSASVLGLFKIIRTNFEDSKFPLMLGISLTIGLSGAIYGGKPMTNLIDNFGHQTPILGLIIIGFLLSAILYMAIPVRESDIQKTDSIKSDVKNVLTNPHFVWLCLIGGLMVGPIEGFADTWCTQFLIKVQGLDKNVASYLPSMIFVGLCFGGPVLVYIADKIKNHTLTITICALLMGLLLIFVLFVKLKEINIWLIFLLIGGLSSYQTIMIYKSLSYFPERLKMLASACANMIIMSFGSVFHASIGSIMDYLWNGEIVDGIRIYSSEIYQYSLMVVPAACIISVIGLIFILISEKKNKQIPSN